MQLTRLYAVVVTAAAFCAPHVFAQDGWTLLKATPSWTSFYYQKASIKRDKGVGYITLLVNNEPLLFNNIVFQSKVSREEVDCKKATFFSLQSNLYSDKFAGGDLVFVSQSPSASQIVFPNSWMEDMYKVVCSGRR